MRLGLIARADNSGLGVQTLGFYKHMHPDKTLVVDISDLNHNKVYPERYPDAKIICGIPTRGDIGEFLENLDVVFIAEAAYNPALYTMAKEMGVKIANQYNYEFFDWLANPGIPVPDMFIAPSAWHYHEVDEYCSDRGVQHVYRHCPVDRADLPFREISKARKFLHIAGRSAAHDRNGTESVIRASKFVAADVKIVVHFQGEQGLGHQMTRSVKEYMQFAGIHGNPNKLTIEQYDYKDYSDGYASGDVMILPRRYGGNCLPLNEALSCGMPVIMPMISPNDSFLPAHWLVPAVKIGEFEPRTIVDIFDVDPMVLAAKIDQFAAMTESQMLQQNRLANAIANSISWENMEPAYRQMLEGLCTPS